MVNVGDDEAMKRKVVGDVAVIEVLGDAVFFFSSRRRHTRLQGDWSSDVCSSDLVDVEDGDFAAGGRHIGVGGEATDVVVGLRSWLGIKDIDIVVFREFGVDTDVERSEERRVGKEGRSRWSPYHLKKKKKKRRDDQ